MVNYLFTDKQYARMVSEREPKYYENYGKVIVISTKTIKYALNVLETIIPMTFFTLSMLGEFIYRKYGNIELKRVVIKND